MPEWRVSAAVFLKERQRSISGMWKGFRWGWGVINHRRCPAWQPRDTAELTSCCVIKWNQRDLWHTRHRISFSFRTFPLNFATSTCPSSLRTVFGDWTYSGSRPFPAIQKWLLPLPNKGPSTDLYVCEGQRGLVLSQHGDAGEWGAKSWSPSQRWTIRQHRDTDHSCKEPFQNKIKKKTTTHHCSENLCMLLLLKRVEFCFSGASCER